MPKDDANSQQVKSLASDTIYVTLPKPTPPSPPPTQILKPLSVAKAGAERSMSFATIQPVAGYASRMNFGDIFGHDLIRSGNLLRQPAPTLTARSLADICQVSECTSTPLLSHADNGHVAVSEDNHEPPVSTARLVSNQVSKQYYFVSELIIFSLGNAKRRCQLAASKKLGQ
jgi:hypothetical protein